MMIDLRVYMCSNVGKLVGIPYSDMSCWELVEGYHGIKFDFPRFSITDIKAQLRQKKEIQWLFEQITFDELKDGDIILQGTHVSIWIDNGIDLGILHSAPPYSEFVPTDIPDLNVLGTYFKSPTYWRLNDNHTK